MRMYNIVVAMYIQLVHTNILFSVIHLLYACEAVKFCSLHKVLNLIVYYIFKIYIQLSTYLIVHQ